MTPNKPWLHHYYSCVITLSQWRVSGDKCSLAELDNLPSFVRKTRAPAASVEYNKKHTREK